jgi:hypothetical protein
MDQLTVASCTTAPAEKTANNVAPARACDGWCRSTSRKSPDNPENSPIAEKTTNTLSAAA